MAMQVFYYTTADRPTGVDTLGIWDMREVLGKNKGYKHWKNDTTCIRRAANSEIWSNLKQDPACS